MEIACHGRVGPNLDRRAIRPNAGERQCRGDIGIGRKAADGLARSAGEDAFGRGQSNDVDAVGFEIGRVLKPPGGFRVIIVTLATPPSAAATTASSPSSAPEGTRTRPSCRCRGRKAT